MSEYKYLNEVSIEKQSMLWVHDMQVSASLEIAYQLKRIADLLVLQADARGDV